MLMSTMLIKHLGTPPGRTIVTLPLPLELLVRPLRPVVDPRACFDGKLRVDENHFKTT